MNNQGANVKRLCAIAALALTLAGCASTGPKIEAAQLSELQQGKTTVAEVIKRFGRPSILSKNMDGTQTAAYMWAEDRSTAGALVPLASALAGKADADVDSVIFSFDTKGVLSGYKPTQAAADEPVATTAQVTPQPGQTMQAGPPPSAVSAGAAPTVSASQPAKKAARKSWTLESFQPVRQVENPR